MEKITPTKLSLLSLLPIIPILTFIYMYFNHQNHFNISLFPKFFTPSYSPMNITNPPHHYYEDLPSIFTNILKRERKRKNNNNKNKSNLEKIEDGLARARAAIREAARTQTYKSEVEEVFIPRGPIYRNPFAFHQSHIEMVKRFKIWTYKEGEQPMMHIGPMSNIYGIEGHFIDQMEDANMSKFMARDPNEAHVFFLPISIVEIVEFLYRPLVSYDLEPLRRVSLDYVNVVAHKHPYWNRSRGADHFMLSCHDWAPFISKANPKYLQNLIRALCNANSSEGFQPKRDVSIPEVNIPRGEFGPPRLGFEPTNRTIFAFFAGGNHGHVRKYLFENWDKDDEIKIYDYLPKNLNYSKMLSQSKFCLCPSGYEVASPRIVEAIFAECVPVIIKDDYAFPFSDVLDWSKFSIHIPKARIPEIKNILKEISMEKYIELLEGVRRVKWHFTLNRPAKPFDMIHMILHSIWLRRINIRLSFQ